MTTSPFIAYKGMHPNQRYAAVVDSSTRPGFVGATEAFDVFWLAEKRRILIKFSSNTGDGFWQDVGHPATGWCMGSLAHRNVRSTPNEETTELILSMCKCFVRDNRPPEWDEELAT